MTAAEPEGGRLCAVYTGGTVTYFSPEQAWLKEHLRHVCNEASYLERKRKWQVTAATSDLYQASLVVLEMHSRMEPPKQDPSNPNMYKEQRTHKNLRYD